ncbi:MAG: heme o synthase [Burkholderiales bacterium]
MKPLDRNLYVATHKPFIPVALKDYFSLTKPGIILGNMISAAGGFFLGSRGYPDFTVLAATLCGIALVIGGACALNNGIDRDIDALMQRTRNRPLVNKRIPLAHAFVLGWALALTGMFLLVHYTNLLTVEITGIGFTVYTGLYSLWLKRTRYGTWAGSISGAVPPLAAYCAAGQKLDTAGIVLFATYVLWQLPHAYAIGVLHRQDYKRAAIPVLPVVRGIAWTKKAMPVYIGLFTLCALLLFFTHNTGVIYFAAVSILGLDWMRVAWRDRNDADSRRWARKSIGYSIAMVVVLSLTMSMDFSIPESGLPASVTPVALSY